MQHALCKFMVFNTKGSPKTTVRLQCFPSAFGFVCGLAVMVLLRKYAQKNVDVVLESIWEENEVIADPTRN